MIRIGSKKFAFIYPGGNSTPVWMIRIGMKRLAYYRSSGLLWEKILPEFDR